MQKQKYLYKLHKNKWISAIVALFLIMPKIITKKHAAHVDFPGVFIFFHRKKFFIIGKNITHKKNHFFDIKNTHHRIGFIKITCDFTDRIVELSQR